MSTQIARCPIYEQRFVVCEAHRVTCSTRCRAERFRRLQVNTPIFARVVHDRTPNRAGAALRETRAAVVQLLDEGRRAARLTSDLGDRS